MTNSKTRINYSISIEDLGYGKSNIIIFDSEGKRLVSIVMSNDITLDQLRKITRQVVNAYVKANPNPQVPVFGDKKD